MDSDRIVTILSTLVAFDTTSRNSNLAIIDWIEAYLAPRGFTAPPAMRSTIPRAPTQPTSSS